MMRHYLLEIDGVTDFDDMTPKPGLDTEEGRARNRRVVLSSSGNI